MSIVECNVNGELFVPLILDNFVKTRFIGIAI
jgi:hypothetical protein